MKLFFCIFVLLFPLISAAEVYEQKEQNGVTYSDTPLSNGVKIDARTSSSNAITSVKPTPTPASPSVSYAPAPASEDSAQAAPLDYVPTANTTDEKPRRLPEPNAPPANTPEDAATTGDAANATAPIKKPYLVFSISSPKDQDTIQNQPSIPVTLTVEPALQTGDLVQLFYDGKPLDQPAASTTLDLPTLERGVHQVYAVIFSKGVIVKQTNTITLNVQRVSIINKPQ